MRFFVYRQIKLQEWALLLRPTLDSNLIPYSSIITYFFQFCNTFFEIFLMFRGIKGHFLKKFPLFPLRPPKTPSKTLNTNK